jgi:SSS family solute:Na+ symporter
MISLLDNIVLVGYFVFIFVFAFWITYRDKKSKERGSADYFLASRSAGWLVIGASLFASNIGAEHIIGLAGSGARGDMPAAQFEILASLVLLLLGWLFVPFYLKSGVFTMPEFLERRYSSGARTYLSLVSIIAYVLTKISLTIFAGALVFEVLGIPFWTGALVVVIATGLYTILGGLKAVLYTDMVQMFILLGGMFLVTFFGFDAIGGWEGLTNAVASAGEERGFDPSNFFNLWRPGDDTAYPWTGMMFGAPILGVWYWCTDQFIVQRVLSAKDISNARRGTIFAGFLKQLPILLFVIPGVLAFALGYSGLLSLDLNNPDMALPLMVSDLLPSGIRGLVLAGLLAALMSSLSSAFNSCSTLFTIDFYKKYRPNSSERELVWVGQTATTILVIISLGYIPLMKVLTESGGIIQYMQSVQAYISPPIAAAFLLGLFVKRINARGALFSLWFGFGVGVLRLLFEFLVKNGSVDPTQNAFVSILVEVNFLHFALILFVICAVLMILVSLTDSVQMPEKLRGVTFDKLTPGFFEAKKSDIILSLLLIAIVILIWILFSPLGFA